MQTYLVHMRTPLKTLREGRAFDFFSFQVVVGSGTGMLFLNPLMWCLLILYVAFGPKVIAIYHLLFPGPILYLGAFCLIFGNFFYLYLYLLACAKRKAYHLVFWSLFIPIYWLLMSVAGMYAFVELLLKPHYWQKTVHGLHLQGQSQAYTSQQAAAFVKQQTQNVPAIRAIPQQHANVVLRTITTAMKAITTLPVPAISIQQKRAVQVAKQAKVRDLWLYATMITACCASICFCWYYFQNHEIILYQDALSHMRISRSVFDSATPGLAQLGTVWLPLPHLLMWPFIWNDYLWHSGLAGSFVSMPCYVIASIYLYRAGKGSLEVASLALLEHLPLFSIPMSSIYKQHL